MRDLLHTGVTIPALLCDLLNTACISSEFFDDSINGINWVYSPKLKNSHCTHSDVKVKGQVLFLSTEMNYHT